MENQHRQIKGYRDLSQEEIDSMNEVKAKGAELEELIAKIRKIPGIDMRWLEAAEMELKTGMMKLTRSIAKPTSF